MSIEPSSRSVSFTRLKNDYGATHFEAALARWLAQYQNPHFTTKKNYFFLFALNQKKIYRPSRANFF